MLPTWASEIASLYESDAASQFILYGNVEDRFLIPAQPSPRIGALKEFFQAALLGAFDVVLSYDLGNGIRIDRGAPAVNQWPGGKETAPPPKQPRGAIEWLTRYFRYLANLHAMGNSVPQTACVLWSAHLVAPAVQGSTHYELGAIASLLRDWAVDDTFLDPPIATFLVCNNFHDLHPLVTRTPRAAKIKVPLPEEAELASALELLRNRHPEVFAKSPPTELAPEFRGASLHAVETLVRTTVAKQTSIDPEQPALLRKRMVEEECRDLIEFIPPKRNLNDLHGLDAIKQRFREDLELWRLNDPGALPMGYLICGPVGTGKTFLVECLAGEAGVPVLKIRNFRDRWVGSTESNLETIFRLLQALGRCFVFIDEADQALGRRDNRAADSGLSGRIYSMIAKEMGNPDNRGRIIWVLASSRPDLIEVDLKRPGRVDVKLPIFPTEDAAGGYALLRALCSKRGIELPEKMPREFEKQIPDLLTPGAAEALAVRTYRLARINNHPPQDALATALGDYQAPVAAETLWSQIRLAASEASEASFVPERFRNAPAP